MGRSIDPCSELADQAGVPPKTIRYYEEIRLLPEPDRTSGGYRDFDQEALSRLRFIRAAQSVGFSLGEIREILAFRDRGEAPCEHVTDLIEQHARDLSDRIRALERMRSDLGRLARKAREVPPRTGKFCHIIESAGR